MAGGSGGTARGESEAASAAAGAARNGLVPGPTLRLQAMDRLMGSRLPHHKHITRRQERGGRREEELLVEGNGASSDNKGSLRQCCEAFGSVGARHGVPVLLPRCDDI